MNNHPSNIRLKEIKLTNFRCFENLELHIDETKQVTILLANNGSGKSSILDAISIAISPFIGHFPGLSIKNISEWDICEKKESTYPALFDDEATNSNYQRAEYASIYSEFIINGTISKSEKIRRRDNNVNYPTQYGVKELERIAEPLLGKINNGEEVSLPMIAYYGTSRNLISVPERRRDFNSFFKSYQAYDNALKGTNDFKRFMEWFNAMENLERREKVEKLDLTHTLSALNAVRKSIESIFVNCKNPRIELAPLRFVIDKFDKKGRALPLRMEQLSDGYRMMIAMVADIASRLAEGNPDCENPLERHGLVLIDEVDQHLHPEWQRTILHTLAKTFPNVQFIVTTHSPVVALGGADISQIIVLNENGTITEVEEDEVAGYDVGLVLVSELFGLENNRSPKWDKDINRRDELLSLLNLSTEQEQELAEIDSRLSALSFGESVREARARKTILETADRIKKEEDEKVK